MQPRYNRMHGYGQACSQGKPMRRAVKSSEQFSSNRPRFLKRSESDSLVVVLFD